MGNLQAEEFVSQVVSRLEQRRLAIGLSRRALALRAGLDPRTVGLVERGERCPSLHTLFLLAEALELAPESLFEGLL